MGLERVNNVSFIFLEFFVLSFLLRINVIFRLVFVWWKNSCGSFEFFICIFVMIREKYNVFFSGFFLRVRELFFLKFLENFFLRFIGNLGYIICLFLN